MSRTKVKQNLIDASFGNILEQIVYRADGRTITTSRGNITVPNVTSITNVMSSTFVDIPGTNIAYQPPEGATLVAYEANLQARVPASGSTPGQMAPSFFINFDGIQVDPTRRGYLFQKTWDEEFSIFLTMQITGGSDSIASEQIGSWTTPKTIQARACAHNSAYGYSINGSYHYAAAAANLVTPPLIKITAYS